MTDEEITAEARAIGRSENAVKLLLGGEDESLFGMAGAVLIMRGVMAWRPKWFLFGSMILTPTRFGLRVRAYLQENRHD